MPVVADVQRLLAALEGLVGKKIAIEESISRDRKRGHDRHWSTQSRLVLVVRRCSGTISGAQLILEGDDVWYATAADAITAATFEPCIVITEHFEECTERRTTIRVV
jgi:hypothetical protein